MTSTLRFRCHDCGGSFLGPLYPRDELWSPGDSHDDVRVVVCQHCHDTSTRGDRQYDGTAESVKEALGLSAEMTCRGAGVVRHTSDGSVDALAGDGVHSDHGLPPPWLEPAGYEMIESPSASNARFWHDYPARAATRADAPIGFVFDHARLELRRLEGMVLGAGTGRSGPVKRRLALLRTAIENARLQAQEGLRLAEEMEKDGPSATLTTQHDHSGATPWHGEAF